jgi:hypothetical protein
MTQPALAVLESFTQKQRRQAIYPFEANERRDWHFVPRRRPGVTLGDMQPTQQERVWALLRAGLSQQGMQKTRDVISTEAIYIQHLPAVMINGVPQPSLGRCLAHITPHLVEL